MREELIKEFQYDYSDKLDKLLNKHVNQKWALNIIGNHVNLNDKITLLIKYQIPKNCDKLINTKCDNQREEKTECNIQVWCVLLINKFYIL